MMRSFSVFAALTITTVAAAMVGTSSDANAVVYCVEGIYRAGCVVRRPAVAPVRAPAVAPVRATARGTARRTTRRVVRRSDIALKRDISLLGHLHNGLGFYRFSYNDSNKVYVGVMAQEVQNVAPMAVVRRGDGYLSVNYERLGLRFQTYDQWVASGARVPAGAPATWIINQPVQMSTNVGA